MVSLLILDRLTIFIAGCNKTNFTLYFQFANLRRDSIIGNAVVLKTTALTGLQVRVLFSPPFYFLLAFKTSKTSLKATFFAASKIRK